MIELLLVFAAVVGVLAIMVPRLRRGPAARSVASLSRYRSPDSLRGYMAGMLATLAAASFCTAMGMVTATSASVGALVAVVWVVVQRRDFWSGVFLGATGVLGIIGSVAGFLADAQCGGGAPLPARLACVVVLGVAASLGVVVAGMTGRFHGSGALASFAALEILIFLATPLGVSVLDTSGFGVAISLVIAALFGFFAFLAPRVVIGLGAVAVGVASAAAAAAVGVACGARTWDAVIAVAAFTVLYLACSPIARVVRR